MAFETRNSKLKTTSLDIDEIRARLAGVNGREYWRSLEELAETEEFREFLHREFPRQMSAWADGFSRRDFLRLMGASLALGGLNACAPSRTDEKILPYVRQPEEMVPGKPLFFTTAFTLAGIATGLLVESHEGRPTKVEGNPLHPASLGATDAFAQASVLALYDPDRSQVVTNGGRISTWSAFYDALTAELDAQRIRQGAGLRILTETITSPTLAHQMRALLAKFPRAKWHAYEPAGRDNARRGALMAFGKQVDAYYRLEQADVILSLDSDFLFYGPGSVRYARDFAARRQVFGKEPAMNRLYVIESSPSVTGSAADHSLSLPPGQIEPATLAIAGKLRIRPRSFARNDFPPAREKWIAAVARDLEKSRGRSVVIAGDSQSPLVHALAHAINGALGNAGQTVIYTDPVETGPADQAASLKELIEDMDAGQVEMLVILGGNPAFTAPVDLGLEERLSKVKFRVRLGLYEDETSSLCHWHIPEAHYLEAWSDARAYDGTVSILQPLIAPLYDGRSAHEFLSGLAGEPARSGYDIARDYWKERHRGNDFELFWRTSLHDGVVAGTAYPARRVVLLPIAKWETKREDGGTPPADSFSIVFRPDPTIFDGRFANNGWLQELPKPLTKLTWDNAAFVGPASAERLGVQNEELVELRFRGRAVRAPIWIVPGQPENTVTVHLGYGRTRAGKVGNGAGFNAYRLRTTDALWQGGGLEIKKIGRSHPLACTQLHHSLEGRNLVRVGTLAEYRENPDFARKMAHEPEKGETLYPEHPYKGYAWGMAIDLNACIGCNACVVACQAENNLPVVGKKEVRRGREMHWLRIDRYYRGPLDRPETVHEPVLCMHCENAPCEIVCPVAATVHSSEGLNDMVYNRCVGTRYCSNNCPYKVRRFNFLQYADFETPSLKLARNPDVTVRSRGVMEKCTYCVQRINAARIQAKKEDREIRDGEIATACQAACPAQAIVFGNINDPDSRVAKRKAEPLNYGLLAELNTRPRTTYLAKIRNPNPEIETD